MKLKSPSRVTGPDPDQIVMGCLTAAHLADADVCRVRLPRLGP